MISVGLVTEGVAKQHRSETDETRAGNMSEVVIATIQT
jgi:hypothetical protein